MKQVEFEASYRAEWQAFAEWLHQQSFKKKHSTVAVTFAAEELPARYRQLCHHLSIATDRCYSSTLIAELQLLVEEGHQHLYGGLRETNGSLLHFVKSTIPQTFRQEKYFCWAAGLLFFAPLIATLIVLQFHPDFVYYLLQYDTITQMEYMYKPGSEVSGFQRDAGGDTYMWAHYIWNNIRIDFQCFATGILFGLGSIFYVTYNAVTIGAVAGHLTHLGYITPFWSFVAGHSGPELTGIVLAGAAGLKLGYALISPGELSRIDALRVAARTAITLLVGAAFLTFLAAFIEGFWSPQVWITPWVKYLVGGLIWLLVWSWLLRGGRHHGH